VALEVTRSFIIAKLRELEAEHVELHDHDPADNEDFESQSNDQLEEAFCLSGLFQDNFDGHDETELVIIEG